ncbi:MAG: signaling recognition particle receptor family protein [Rhodocyclaceae bacterium]|nr:signaling recognition particle receptor family protein [Rhodocyclaceae bacterium]
MFGFLKKTAADAPPAAAEKVAPAKLTWAERLKAGLARTRAALNTPLGELFARGKIDAELLEELESTLLMADCGIDATEWLLTELRAKVKKERIESPAALRAALIELLTRLLTPLEQPLDLNHPSQNQRPYIIMLAGVNGAGKTTSIGKLAKRFQQEGHGVLLAAGDTFRAAAREQLTEWGRRNDVTVIAQPSPPPDNLASLGSPPKGAKNSRGGPSSFSGDPAAVIFDAISAARARGIDVMIADTAGRLPTQLNLMEEIAKVRRVIQKAEPTGPHEVLLVLDANIGQNAIAQVKAFDKAIKVTGLIVTKLDGTAKGGVLAAIARQCPKPVRFIGVGEGIDDLQPFRAREFVEALFG